MRIAVGGVMHESNTFAPLPTDRGRFEQGSVTRGDALLATWREAHHEVGGFIAGAAAFDYELVPTVMAWATPAGPVTDDVLDEVVGEIVAGCRRSSVDGLLLALHGAMVSGGYPEADAEVLRRLRAALGADLPIVATLDFHANVSPAMAEYADALVGYQTYPHTDQRPIGLAAAGLIARTIREEIRPRTAVARPPMILNLLGQDTGREPMRTLMTLAREAERRPGVLSVSLMAGFPYADTPAMGPSVIAVADGDSSLAQDVADELGGRMWDVRRELFVPCPRPEEAVRRAMAADRRPVVLVDLGDNIGGGSAGDGTVLLAELLRQRAAGAVVVLYDPDGVEAARQAGPGGRFERNVGGRVDRMHGEPVSRSAASSDRCTTGPGSRISPATAGAGSTTRGRRPSSRSTGRTRWCSIRCGRRRSASASSPASGSTRCSKPILVVKAAVAYKAAYGPIAGEVIEVDTPGLTAIDPARFTFRQIRRPMFPLDD